MLRRVWVIGEILAVLSIGAWLSPQPAWGNACENIFNDTQLTALLQELHAHNVRTEAVSQGDSAIRASLRLNHRLIALYRSFLSQNDLAIHQETLRLIDKIDFLLAQGSWRTIAQLLDPIFIETELSYITVKLNREDIQKKQDLIKSIEGRSGLTARDAQAYSRSSAKEKKKRSPQDVQVLETLLETLKEVDRLTAEVKENLEIFGRQYESYRRLSAHIFYASLGPEALKQRGKDTFFPVHFPKNKALLETYKKTAEYLNKILGWQTHNELFKGSKDLGSEFLVNKDDLICRIESDKYERHKERPSYDQLKDFFWSERISMTTSLKRVRRAELSRATKNFFFRLVMVGSKIAVSAARANNIPVLRRLGPQWVVALFGIAFAQVAKEEYFPRIHEVLRAPNVTEQLAVLRHHLRTTDRDLLIAFSMLIENEAADAWEAIRKQIIKKVANERRSNPDSVEAARLEELGRDMDKAAQQGLGMGSLSFLSEPSPMTSVFTLATAVLATVYGPGIVEAMGPTMAATAAGIWVTSDALGGAGSLWDKLRIRGGKKLLEYQQAFKEVLEEMIAEGQFPNGSGEAAKKDWMAEIERRLVVRGFKPEEMDRLAGELVLDPTQRERVDSAIRELETGGDNPANGPSAPEAPR